MKLLGIATLALLPAITVMAQKGKKGGGGGGGGGGGATSSELLKGECKPVILIFARASTEPGNMGGSMGPMMCSGLKKHYPDKVICQGVGQPYSAGLAENVAPQGTTPAAIGEATRMFTTANTKCASSIIVFGGYSQGTAVMMNAVSKLSAPIKQKVVGGVLFGYTKNAQQKGKIPNYPADQVKVFCNPSGTPGKYKDGVCGGALNVNGGHFAYMGNGDGPKALAFLQSKIDPALGKGGNAAPAAGGEAGEAAPAQEEEAAPAKGKGKGKLGKGKAGKNKRL